MPKVLSLAEFRKMVPADLHKEVAGQRSQVAVLTLAVKLGKEKGTHLLKAARKQLARMLTVLSETRRQSR